MGKRRGGGISKVKAIQNALGRLGWHASAKDVVVFLANHGIEVSEGLIHKVKLESLKDSGRKALGQAKVRQSGRRPAAAPIRKIPKPRSDRK